MIVPICIRTFVFPLVFKNSSSRRKHVSLVVYHHHQRDIIRCANSTSKTTSCLCPKHSTWSTWRIIAVESRAESRMASRRTGTINRSRVGCTVCAIIHQCSWSSRRLAGRPPPPPRGTETDANLLRIWVFVLSDHSLVSLLHLSELTRAGISAAAAVRALKECDSFNLRSVH